MEDYKNEKKLAYQQVLGERDKKRASYQQEYRNKNKANKAKYDKQRYLQQISDDKVIKAYNQAKKL